MEINSKPQIHWNAHWIWNDGEESPRNEWWLFRKNFELPSAGWDEAGLAITADSRYVLYVNGELAGRGPVRSWPFEQAFDTYEVGHLLKPGQRNCIAVMVLHFGVSTFYYVAGRGGLLAQLDLRVDGKVAGSIGSDGTWKTARYAGQDSRAPRMSCQQAFAERIDARRMDDTWMQTGFADDSWSSSAVIGRPGMSPWVELKPKDIPHLTEETVSPVRVEALNKVRPLTWTTCIDARVQMDPASERHANAIAYTGYIAGVLRVPCDVSAVIGFPYAPPNMNGLIVNGNRYGKKDFRSVQSEKYLSVDLKAGDNLVLVELVGHDHGRGVFMGLDCGTEFEWLPLLPEEAVSIEHSPFVSLGPFELYEYIDHQHSEEITDKECTLAACAGKQGTEDELNEEQLGKVSAFRKAGECRTAQELAALAEWLRPVSLRLYSPESVLALSIWKKSSEPLPVPASLQNAVTANPEAATVPLFPDADTEIIIDFGRELTGFLTFELDASEGTVIDGYGFEYMRDDWVQHTYYLENTLRYICREGRQRYISPVRRGLRYVAVTVRGAERPVKLYNVQMRQSHYPVAEVGRFRCSDALLDDIWEISKYTTKLCMEDTFVDCPAYEQTFWVGDSRNEALIGYYVFGGEAIVKRCLDLVPGSRTQTPLYADQVPSGWSSVIPNWTFFWAIACREYFERTGDTEYACTVWPHVQYTLDSYLKLLDERGLLNMRAWNFLDWAPIDQPRNGIVAHQNLYLARALRCAAELARTAGEKEQAARYFSATEALVEAINDHLWSEEKQAYLDCIHADGRRSDIFSMQTQVSAYLCEVAVGQRKAQLETYLLSPPAEFVPIGSPFMSFFYYEALAKLGRVDLMVTDIRSQYGQMIEFDATTCWEMYPKRTADGAINPQRLTRSHCHAWSSAPGYFLGAYVLGVRSLEPGWGKIAVEPSPCGLTWARGSVPLPQDGRIDVSWRIAEDGRIRVEVRTPAHIEIEVRIPEGYEGETVIHRLGSSE